MAQSVAASDITNEILNINNNNNKDTNLTATTKTFKKNVAEGRFFLNYLAKMEQLRMQQCND